jgi:hypothetical protein
MSIGNMRGLRFEVYLAVGSTSFTVPLELSTDRHTLPEHLLIATKIGQVQPRPREWVPGNGASTATIDTTALTAATNRHTPTAGCDQRTQQEAFQPDSTTFFGKELS